MCSEQQRQEGSSFAANEAKESSGFAEPVGLNGQLRKNTLQSFGSCLLPFQLRKEGNFFKRHKIVAGELPSHYKFLSGAVHS